MLRIHVRSAPNRPTRTLELGVHPDGHPKAGKAWRRFVRAGEEFVAEGLEAERIDQAITRQGVGKDITFTVIPEVQAPIPVEDLPEGVPAGSVRNPDPDGPPWVSPDATEAPETTTSRKPRGK